MAQEQWSYQEETKQKEQRETARRAELTQEQRDYEDAVTAKYAAIAAEKKAKTGFGSYGF